MSMMQIEITKTGQKLLKNRWTEKERDSKNQTAGPRERLQPAQIRLIVCQYCVCTFVYFFLWVPAFEKATFCVMDEPWADVTSDILELTKSCWIQAWGETTGNLTWSITHHLQQQTLSTEDKRCIQLQGGNRKKVSAYLNRSRKCG